MNDASLQKEFVWKALHEGWSVKKVADNSFKFTKAHNGQLQEFTYEGFLRNFLQTCLMSK